MMTFGKACTHPGRRPAVMLTIILVYIMTSLVLDGQQHKKNFVSFVRNEEKKKIDVLVDGKLFTSYNFSDRYEKTFLFPVIAPDGTVITRGFPVEPRKGERVDHPHHTGIWFNHGNVNGLDFWNNSSAIPANQKNLYGHIVHQKTTVMSEGKRGILEVRLLWEDNAGNVIMSENARYVFSGDENSRTIDHISTLMAVNGPVTFGDSKEGLFAIRVDRAFEMPSNEPLIFTDEKGNPTTVQVLDNTGVTGMYQSENGLKGDAVWGTRNSWVILSGDKNGVPVSMAMFDHPKNPGFPAFAHARGYGLFSINNFGQNSYDPKLEKKTFTLKKDSKITLYHRFYVESGSMLTPGNAEKIFKDFSEGY